jgi:hypothetical protein
MAGGWSSILALVLSTSLSIFVSIPSYGTELCSRAHLARIQVADQGQSLEDFRAYRDQQNSKDLRQFRDRKEAVWQKIEKLPANQKRSWDELLAAIEFFDWKHFSPRLLTRFLENRNLEIEFRRLYDSPYEPSGQAYTNFVAARDFLRQEKPEVEIRTLQKLHSLLMKNGIEGLEAKDLGKIRSRPVSGRVVEENPVSEKGVLNIQDNIYMSHSLVRVTEETVPALNIKSLWLDRNNRVEDTVQKAYWGRILYPSLGISKPSLIESLRGTHPQLVSRIEDLLAQRVQSLEELVSRPGYETLNREFVEALLSVRFDKFKHDKAKLGDVVIGQNENQCIDLVADFARDLVAIHPFRNGNGRTTRLFANFLLTREGLPPMRLADPDVDLFSAPDVWREHMRLSVVNTARLYKDFEFRLQQDLSPYDSALLLYPELPDFISAQVKKGEAQVVTGQNVYHFVDASQFSAFLKEIARANPELIQQISQDRVKSMGKMVELFSEFIQTKTVRYIHDKHGALDVSLRFVDPEFIEVFGQAKASDRQSYQSKIDRWYFPEELVWRGLANRHHDPNINEILDYFRKVSPHLASNQALNRARAGEPLLSAMRTDFVNFNQDLVSAKFVEMAMDHHTVGRLYPQSYGFSTSRREVVGKAFAMGAMVLGPYGEHQSPELQQKLKSRINIASYRALKDVDLSRLRQVAEDFRYRYPRQAEVMGIGGTDPDAVVLIQKISDKGQVTETFYRNPENPNEILVIEGRFVPGEKDLQSAIIKERRLLFESMPVKPPPAAAAPEQNSVSALGALVDQALKFFGL